MSTKSNKAANEVNTGQQGKDQVQANTSGAAVVSQKKPKKRGRLSRMFSSFNATQITLLVLGLLIAILLVAGFAFLYDSAKKSNKAIPQNGLISSDEDKSYLTQVINANSGMSIDKIIETSSITGAPGMEVDSRITKDTVNLLNDLKAAYPDENPNIVAAYTSVQDFANNYNQRMEYLMEEEGYSRKNAEAQVLTEMMKPGTDEHSTGLLVNFGVNNAFDPNAFAASESFQWLKDNAYRYGYVLRYPEGKDAVTLHGYDPTAFRYVGKEAAEVIHDGNLTLEEYNQQLAQQQAQIEAERQAAEQAAAAQAAQEQAGQQAAQ